jgi:hypothetical protein
MSEFIFINTKYKFMYCPAVIVTTINLQTYKEHEVQGAVNKFPDWWLKTQKGLP